VAGSLLFATRDPLAAVASRSGHGAGWWGVHCPAIHRQMTSTT
jgi:hypothetical protein